MRIYAKRTFIAVLSLGSVLSLTSVASAQIRFNPTQRLIPINPNPEIAPGVRLQQFAYNTAVLGRAYSQIPPYLYGFNPSAGNFHPLANPQFRQLSGVNPFNPGFVGAAGIIGVGSGGGGGYGGFGGGAVGGGYSAGGIDPMTGLPGGGYGGMNQWGWNPWGSNIGPAMELAAYGKVGLDQEQARILREQANQAKLDTRKKLVDTLAYIRANQYTFSQEQADIAKRLIERVQKTPTKPEINSGKSLNLLLSDLVDLLKVTDQSMRLPTIAIDEDVLKLLNVSGPGSNGNIALLRDNGRFAWPSAITDKVLSEKDRKDIELEAQQLYQQANNGQVDPNTLKDLEAGLTTAHANLAKQVNALPTNSYLEVKAFLDSFDSAVVAMKKGDVPSNWEFQNKFAKGGKTVQQLVDYMGSKGLRFAAARSGEERGNFALQAGLAAYSIALHSQISVAAPTKDKGS